MDRDLRAHLEEELTMVGRDADEMRALADRLRKFAPNHGAAKERYQETADLLSDMADDLQYAKPFADMQAELDAEEASQAAAEQASDIAWHQRRTV